MNEADKAQQLLPIDAYYSQEWYATERTQLFDRSWVFACPEAAVAHPGDYVTLRFMDYGLFVVRDRSGALRAFHNVCRHRGCEVLENSGNTKSTIVCPYHRWVYQLDGKLRGLPDEQDCFEGIEKSELSLHPAGVGVYAGLVFVNPDPNTNDFNEWCYGLEDHPWPHRFDDGSMSYSGEIVYEMDCNWKVFYENAIDGYHLGYLHDKTLGKVYPDKNIWEAVGPHHLWYSTETGAKKSNTLLSVASAESNFVPRLHGDDEANYPGVVMLFPLTILSPSPWGFYVSILEPAGPEKTFMRTLAWSPGGDGGRFKIKDGPHEPIRTRDLDKHPLETGNFQIEDMWIVEKVQRNLHSPLYKVGPFAQGMGAETPLYQFQNTVLQSIQRKLSLVDTELEGANTL
ncbi:MAG: SRPBCC family protein [Pseudomonadota bacterium]